MSIMAWTLGADPAPRAAMEIIDSVRRRQIPFVCAFYFHACQTTLPRVGVIL